MMFSVVIPYYDAEGTIGAQLDALASQRPPPGPWEVVVSDNESSDALKGLARTYSERLENLRVVDASDRRGPAHARNVGVQAAKGGVIAFCDADDEVGAGWLAAMSAALDRHDFVACRQDFRKLNPPWAQRIFRDHPQQWGLQRTRYPPNLPFAGGGTLGFRRSVHESVGGFDESWRVLEDKEYCLRVQLAGTELHYVPDAVIHYRCRTTLSEVFKQARSFAEHDLRLYRLYRPRGARPSEPWKRYVGEWDHLLRTVSELRSQEMRASWVWQLGWQVGRLQGSLKHFVPPV